MQQIEIIQTTPGELKAHIEDAIRQALSGISKPKEEQPQNPWMNLDELCAYLPDRPAKQTIYGMVSRGEIPNHKGAKRLRFFKPEIDEWLKLSKRRTKVEHDQAADEFLSSQSKKKKPLKQTHLFNK